MFRTLSRRRPPTRRGAILLVVLTLLALFAVIGLSFALYAESEATAARIHREGESRTGEADPSPIDYVNAAFMGIIYPIPDTDATLAQSGFYGYELARLMYGYNPYTLGSGGHDLSPFNGLGLFPSGLDTLNSLPGIGSPLDRSLVVNYAYQPGSGYSIYPEWTGWRVGPGGAAGGGSSLAYRSIAAPYTYPDLKDLPLAVFNPTTGMVMQPSYYRTYGAFTSTGGAGLITGLEPTNTNWTTPQGRLLVIRPRPIDHLIASDFTAIGTLTPTPAQVQNYVASNGLFPYPPANADGTYTGDVQNIPNPQGQQRNDAIWVYPAGPVRRWNGKLYTALVAPTVIELNGRVNLSMAGNIKNNQTHASDAGVGPPEINPRWVLDNAGLTPGSQTAMLNIIGGLPGIQGRYGMTTPQPQPDRITTLPMASFNNGLVPPSYGRVDFDGVSTNPASDRAYAASTNTSPFPVYAKTRYFDNTTQSGELTNHPALFNPDFWSSTRMATAGRTFPPFDLLRLGTRYGDQWSRYNQADVAQLAPQYLVSPNYPTPANPNPSPSGQFTTTDPANLVRMLVTTQSSSLYRPEVQVPTGAAAGSPAVAPTTRLGPIDLNRPLADYRDLTAMVNQPTPTALSPSNMGNAAAAQIARQRFARDVFVRLVALSGLLVPSMTPDAFYVNDPTQSDYGYLRFNTTVLTPARLAQFQALAQLAANIVDYIDPDDINTTFTWNPMYPVGGTPTFMVNAVGMPNVGTNANQLPPASMGSYVVFGTELPRLVVNEAYAELTNNPNDIGQNNATKPFRFKFWLELVNPLGVADTVLSDGGAARLQYQAGGISPNATSTYPVYEVLIAYPNKGQSGTLLSTSLNTTPTNVTGNPLDPSLTGNLTTPIQTWSYVPAAAPSPPPTLTNDNINLVQPVQGSAGGAANYGLNNGYYVLGPMQNSPQDIFPGGDVPCSLRLQDPAAMPMTTVNSMVYEHSGNNSTDLNDPAMGANLLSRKHTIVLRRLANPYLPPNDPNWLLNPATSPDPVMTNIAGGTYNPMLPPNPYITVDFIENVPTRDRVSVTGDQPPRMAPAGQDTNPSIGKRHVYGAGNGPLGPVYQDNPATVNQAITQQLAAAGAMLSPAHTFFAANSPFGDPGKAAGGSLQNAGTLAWMTHLDRQLINPLEMVSVSATAPALVTQNFTYWPAGGMVPPSYNRHTAESLFLPGLNNGVLSYFGVTPLPQPTATGTSPVVAGFLSRALDLLTVRSFLTGVPVGGREQGKLNINTIWHQALLQALLDSNGGNYFTTTDVTTLWQRLTNTAGGMTSYPAARSQWNNAQSLYSATSGDAPIWGLATYDPSLTTATSTSVAYNNLQRTILRSPDGAGGVSNSLLYNPNPANLTTTAIDSTHVVAVAEPLRKAWNSTTTTGNTFLVVMTVGYFEVRNTNYQPGDRVFLGKELYKEVPGDLRQKFVSVIDRSNLSVDLTSPVNNPTTGTTMGYLQGYTTTASAPPQPWFTNLLDDVQPTGAAATFRVSAANVGGVATVYVNGSAVTLAPNQQFWLGYGNFALNNGDGEIVTISTVTPGANGIATITTALPVQRYHPAGSPVSNQLLGNPGPQPSFDYRDRRYQGVVPYCVRVTPSP
jgi:hypothetical protein